MKTVIGAFFKNTCPFLSFDRTGKDSEQTQTHHFKPLWFYWLPLEALSLIDKVQLPLLYAPFQNIPIFYINVEHGNHFRFISCSCASNTHEPFCDLTVIPVFGTLFPNAAIDGMGCSVVIFLIDLHCFLVLHCLSCQRYSGFFLFDI